MNTKLCKYCQTEIPKKAKICPNCKKKQGGIKKWIIIGVILGLIIGVASSTSETQEPKKVGEVNTTTNKDNSTTTETTASTPTSFKVGEIAEYKDVRVTMTNYTESNGSEFNKPTDGNVFVLVEFEIENNSKKELNISSILNFEAYADDYALNYSLNALMEKGSSNQLDGTVAVGKKFKGVIGYEVSQDWKNLEIRFSADFWNNDKFIFTIDKFYPPCIFRNITSSSTAC